MVPAGLLTDPRHQRLLGFNLTPGIILHELRHALQDARRDPDRLVESEVQAHIFEWTVRIDALGFDRAADLVEAMVLQSENAAGVRRDANPLRDRLLRAVDLALVDWGSMGQFERLSFFDAFSRTEDVELGLSDELLTSFARSRIARLIRVLVDRVWRLEQGKLVGFGDDIEGAPPAFVGLLRGSVPLGRASLRRAMGPEASDDDLVEAWLLLLAVRVGEQYLDKGARAAQRWLKRQLPRIERELIPLDMQRKADWNGLGAP